MEHSTWNAGTLVWCAFGLLMLWGVLAALYEWVVDLVDSLRTRSAPGSSMSPPEGSPEAARDETESSLDSFPWDDAFEVRFDDAGQVVPPEEDELSDDRVRPEPPCCPHCFEAEVPVLYGFPGPEAIEAAEAGTAVLGGCIPGGPAYLCRRCRDGHRGGGASSALSLTAR